MKKLKNIDIVDLIIQNKARIKMEQYTREKVKRGETKWKKE